MSAYDMSDAESDRTYMHALTNALMHGNGEKLFAFLEVNDNSYLNSVIEKIREELDVFAKSPKQCDTSIEYVLSLTWKLLNCGFLDIDLEADIAGIILMFSANENISSRNFESALLSLNKIFANQDITGWLVNEECFLPAIEAIGFKLYTCGDYECQTYLFELLCRIAHIGNIKHWANVWFEDGKTRDMFIKFRADNFEKDCRKTLNYINRNQSEPKIFSFVATSVWFGSYKIQEPPGCDFWIDINYKTKRISFYCNDFGVDDDENNNSWDTILISSDNVSTYSVKANEAANSKELLITLNCSCMSTVKNLSQTLKFDTNEVRIIFWSFLEIESNLELIFGKCHAQKNESYLEKPIPKKYRKITSPSLFYHELEDIAAYPAEGRKSSRKVSNSSFSVDLYEEEPSRHHTNKKTRKVSSSQQNISLDEELETEGMNFVSDQILHISDETLLAQNNKKRMQPKKSRKVSRSQQDILLEEEPETQGMNFVSDEILPTSNETLLAQNNKKRIQPKKGRKVSNSQQDILLKEQDFQCVGKQRKISTSYENIQCEEQDLQCLKEQRKFSFSQENIQYEGEQLTSAEHLTIQNQVENGEDFDPLEIVHEILPPQPEVEEEVPKRVLKKPRKAALVAERKSKEMLSELFSNVSGETSDHASILERRKVHRSTPERDKAKKRKSSGLSGSEVESSEPSWYGCKIKLFESPKKRYSKKGKGPDLTVYDFPLFDPEYRKRPARRKKSAPRAKPRASTNKLSDSDAKSKNSSLEGFNLVVEKANKTTPYKRLSSLLLSETSNKNKKTFSIEDIELIRGDEQECDDIYISKDNLSNSYYDQQNYNENNQEEDRASISFPPEDEMGMPIQIEESSECSFNADDEQHLPETTRRISLNSSSKKSETENHVENPHSSAKRNRKPLNSCNKRTTPNKNDSSSKQAKRDDETCSSKPKDYERLVSEEMYPPNFGLFHRPYRTEDRFNNEDISTDHHNTPIVSKLMMAMDLKSKPNQKHASFAGSHSLKKQYNVLDDENQGKKIHLKQFLESVSNHSGQILDTHCNGSNIGSWQGTNLSENMGSTSIQRNVSSDLSEGDALEILKPRKEILETHNPHYVSISKTLSSEIKNLSHKYLSTIQKHTQALRCKLSNLRRHIVTTIDELMAGISNCPNGDIKSFMKYSYRKLMEVAKKYFKAEKGYQKKLQRLHIKIKSKFIARVLAAQNFSEMALDERMLSRLKLMYSNFLKNVEAL